MFKISEQVFKVFKKKGKEKQSEHKLYEPSPDSTIKERTSSTQRNPEKFGDPL